MNSFLLYDDAYLFFDMFYKNNQIILICPVTDAGIIMEKLSVNKNGVPLTITHKYSQLTYEAAEVLIYNVDAEEDVVTITVHYDGKSQTYTLPHIKTECTNKLSITTQFKDDYKRIDVFYDYYTKHGVEKFYMYYNGKLTDDIIAKFNKPGIVLIEWDYTNLRRNKYSDHYAQMGQMHHALYRYGKQCNEYMIFCDLDEYMYLPHGESLMNYVNKNPHIDIIGFQNVWATTLTGELPDTFPKSFRCSSEMLPLNVRSKCVYKTDIPTTLHIHATFGNLLRKPVYATKYPMFHFYNWTGSEMNKNRSFPTPNIFTMASPWA